METQAKKATLKLHDLKGEWLLEYNVTNRRGIEAFGGVGLSSYRDPATGKEVPLLTPNNRIVSTYMVDQISKKIYPSKNMQDRINLNWLLRHPEVKLIGIKDIVEQRFLNIKSGNKITLVNLTVEQVAKIDNEDYIDKLIGEISITDGPKSFKLQTVRNILATLNITYKLKGYKENPKGERKLLRKKLKDYVRSSMTNARKVEKLIDKKEEIQINYDIKELMSVGLIVESNGMFKIDGTPIGVTTKEIITYFNNNADLKLTLMAKYHNIKENE